MFGLAARLVFGGRVEWARVVADDAVCQRDDARGILFGQFRVVRDHDDQAVVGNFGQQIHNLHAGFGVQRAGGFVGQQDFRVVDKRTGNGHALHLTTGKLARLLVDVVAQAHAAQRLNGTLATLAARNARQRQRQLNVLQNSLVRNKVICLEHEADAVVAVRIPVTVLVLARGHAVDKQVTAVVMVKAADDVEHGGLTRARRAKHGHELVVAERHRHVVERRLREVRHRIGLAHVYQLQHEAPFEVELPSAGARCKAHRARPFLG